MTTLEKAKGALANKYGHEWTEDEHEVAQALLDAVDLMKDINEQLNGGFNDDTYDTQSVNWAHGHIAAFLEKVNK